MPYKEKFGYMYSPEHRCEEPDVHKCNFCKLTAPADGNTDTCKRGGMNLTLNFFRNRTDIDQRGIKGTSSGLNG